MISLGLYGNYQPIFSNFPDGEQNISISKGLEDYLEAAQPILVDWKYQSDLELFQLAMLFDVIRRVNGSGINKAKVKLQIPFMPYSRMDRDEPDSLNPFSLHKMYQLIKSAEGDETEIITYSLHNPKALPEIKNVDIMQPLLSSYLNAQELVNYADRDTTVLVMPDKGSVARYKNLELFGYDVVIGEKKRDFETHKILSYGISEDTKPLLEGKSQAVIIDDIISYGGTFNRLIDALSEQGINQVILITSHAEDSLWKGELLYNHNLNKVITTNTLTNHLSDNKVLVKDYRKLV